MAQEERRKREERPDEEIPFEDEGTEIGRASCRERVY
jgi:hypothetical protein